MHRGAWVTEYVEEADEGCAGGRDVAADHEPGDRSLGYRDRVGSHALGATRLRQTDKQGAVDLDRPPTFAVVVGRTRASSLERAQIVFDAYGRSTVSQRCTASFLSTVALSALPGPQSIGSASPFRALIVSLPRPPA